MRDQSNDQAAEDVFDASNIGTQDEVSLGDVLDGQKALQNTLDGTNRVLDLAWKSITELQEKLAARENLKPQYEPPQKIGEAIAPPNENDNEEETNDYYDSSHVWQPDSKSTSGSYPPVLKTLTYRTATGHKSDITLYGSEGATLYDTSTWANKKGIPFLPKDGALAGDLTWAGLDSENAGGQKSLEIETDGTTPTKLFQIYKMDEAEEPVAAGMDMCVRTAAGGEVFWVDWSTAVSSIPTVTVDVITDIRFDAVNGQIQAEVKTLTVFAAGAGNWGNKIQAFPCETDTVTAQMVIAGETKDVVLSGRLESP